MADETGGGAKKGGGAKRLVLGLVLAVALGGGAFYATYSGMVASPLSSDHGRAASAAHGPEGGHPETVEGPPSFLPLDPILVSVGEGAAERRLQFAAQLEIEPAAAATAAALSPRALDVLNTYLRAVAPADVEDPAAMLRIRAQMLRRIKVVMGEEVVRDLLVTEFIIR